jgi:hypothetical protein
MQRVLRAEVAIGFAALSWMTVEGTRQRQLGAEFS